MQLRRFTHNSTAGALDAVRAAFGADAIILSNRQVDGKVEIIATGTLDEHTLAAVGAMQASESRKPTAEAVASAVRPPQPATPPRASQPERAPIQREATLDSLSRDLAALSEEEAPMSLQPAGTTGSVAIDAEDRDGAGASDSRSDQAPQHAVRSRDQTEPSADKPSADNEGQKSAGPAVNATTSNPLTSPGGDEVTFERPTEAASSASSSSKAAVDDTAAVDVDALEQRLALGEQRREEQATRVECRLRRLEVNLWGETDPVKAAHLRQLLRFGFGAEIAVRLVERLPQDTSADLALRRSLGLMKSSLPIGHDRTGEEPGVTVLSGPEGAGKTTTLVKLATDQVRRGGADSLVIIGADNQRIGAFEMLEVYGRLLGVPVVRARGASEMARLLEGFAHKPLVLVDHVPLERDDALPWGTDPALRLETDAGRKCRHLLVLPTTIESRVFESHLAAQVGHGVTHLVLTQLDRAARPGGCFAPLIRHQVPVAYVSKEARVQESLERADAARLVAMAVNAGAGTPASVDETCLSTLLQPPRRKAPRTPAPTVDVSETRLGPPWTEDVVAHARSPLSTAGGEPLLAVAARVDTGTDPELSHEPLRAGNGNVDRAEHAL